MPWKFAVPSYVDRRTTWICLTSQICPEKDHQHQHWVPGRPSQMADRQEIGATKAEIHPPQDPSCCLCLQPNTDQ
ncbi:hypothetical protein MA16_Dca019108 [Dendrobium catenatum]|uniref:Uncharacterized protein n=1 Tax=Dendrobium catenatum TaxID=906689 RepID=A0A2I0WP99_9ASPA|nr:hypothetical protein MA16_Dca019108 [Dendrobium catenatum]